MAKRGRPTKYHDGLILEVDKYLKQCQDQYTEFHKVRGDRSDSFERVLKVDLPTKEGFAKFIGVDSDTVVEWEKVYHDFSVALRKIMEEQRLRLLNNGLAGAYNPLIAKLVLSANHGMKEKTDITSNDKEIQPIAVIPRN